MPRKIEKSTSTFLCRVEKGIAVARDQGLQPDLLVMRPDGERIIVEICRSNLDYDAKNILIEAQIPEIDQIIAVTPDKQTKHALEDALKKNSEDLSDDRQKPVTLLDAGQCLAEKFDWNTVLPDRDQKLFPDN